MTAGKDTTVAARVHVDLRADVERAVVVNGDADLSVLVRRALRNEADRILGNGPAGANGLFAPGPGAARRNDPATAKAAAAAVAPRRGSQRHRALELIAAAGDDGMTADEVIRELERIAERGGYYGPAVNGVARRVTDLLQAGAIAAKRDESVDADGGHWHYGYPAVTRLTRHGAQATVYVATEKGHAWLRS